jgi:hypothetical protein
MLTAGIAIAFGTAMPHTIMAMSTARGIITTAIIIRRRPITTDRSAS